MNAYPNELAHRREQDAADERGREGRQAKGCGPVVPNPNAWRDLKWFLDSAIERCEYRAELYAGSELGAVYLRLLDVMRKERESCQVSS